MGFLMARYLSMLIAIIVYIEAVTPTPVARTSNYAIRKFINVIKNIIFLYHTHAHAHARTHAHTHTHTHARTHAHTHTHTQRKGPYYRVDFG